MDRISALGVCDDKASKVLGIAADRESGTFDMETLKNISRWDLWNPWATIYEINSTHPLIAKRLKKLSELSVEMNQTPVILFDDNKPESYADDFVKEVAIMFMPWIILIGGILINVFALGNEFESKSTILVLIIAAFASLLKTLYRYPNKVFGEKKVSDALQEVKVSGIRPVPCTIKGKLMGKGNPGYMFSEDFVLEDETGIIFMDYAQPLNIWNSLFGLLKAGKYIDKEAEVVGWYRRAPIPYIEIKEMYIEGEKVKCYSYITQIVFSIILIGALVVWFGMI
jgi:heat shock protein HtpX